MAATQEQRFSRGKEGAESLEVPENWMVAKLHVATYEHECHQPEWLWEQLESQPASEGGKEQRNKISGQGRL